MLSSLITCNSCYCFDTQVSFKEKERKKTLIIKTWGKNPKTMCTCLVSSPKGLIIPDQNIKVLQKEPKTNHIDLIKMVIIHASSQKKWTDLIIIRKQECQNNVPT